jgi:hypothetical protein
MSTAYQIVVCGSIVPDSLQTLEPVAAPAGPFVPERELSQLAAGGKNRGVAMISKRLSLAMRCGLRQTALRQQCAAVASPSAPAPADCTRRRIEFNHRWTLMNTDKRQFGRARHSVRAVCEISCDGARGATCSTSDALWRCESQRDSINQPRVARNELPWVCDATVYNPEEVESARAHRRCNPVGVENCIGPLPRVVRCAANPGLNDSIPLGLHPAEI